MKLRFLTCLMLLVFSAGLDSLSAPKVSVKVSDNWSQEISYDPPNEHRIKWKLTGTDAASIPGSTTRAAIKNINIQQFPVSVGPPELTADTPDCIFDSAEQEIFSTAKLILDAQGGKFHLEGTGFLLRQKDSTLMVSNNVQSFIKRPSISGTTGTNESVIHISSHQGEFHIQSAETNGVVIYRQSVQVHDPKLDLNCEQLTSILPSSISSGLTQPDSITAETNVEMTFTTEKGEPIHASSGKAIYSSQIDQHSTNQILELTDHPRIALANGWMTAEKFLLNRTTGSIVGDINVKLHVESVPSFSSMFGSATNSKLQIIEINSDHFTFQDATRNATFSSRVVVSQPGMTVHSEYLVATLPAADSGVTNHFSHILAETNVLIELVDEHSGQTNRATAQKAVYDFKPSAATTNEVFELTGNPSLTISNAIMTADVIFADRGQNLIRGKGNHHTIFAKHPGDAAPLRSEVFSDEFEFSSTTGLAVYDGGVRAYDPMINLTGKKVTIQLAKIKPGETNRIENLTANGGITFDFASKPFTANDLTNLDLAIAKLTGPKPQETFYGWLATQLSSKTTNVFPAGKTNSNGDLKPALVEDFNRLTQSETLVSMATKYRLPLSAETQTLLAKQPKGAEWVQLNRLILLDAFSDSFTRNQAGDLTHGTGNSMVYQNQLTKGIPRESIELAGHPRLDKPFSYITADDRLVTERTAGKVRFIGYPYPHFFTKMQGLTTNKLPQSPVLGKAKGESSVKPSP